MYSCLSVVAAKQNDTAELQHELPTEFHEYPT